jgi:microsomal dipeptidase-like Zn-dependent dipeptidase
MKTPFADLHCHPNLKPFGQSFDPDPSNPKRDIWYTEGISVFRKWLKRTVGITRFSQADLTSMALGSMKLAFVSLYPFEKGFFINSGGKGPFSALASDIITGIGYHRVRHIQQHLDYFEDLCREYEYFLYSRREHVIDSVRYRWSPAANGKEVEEILSRDNEIAVVFSIEGAHVFNSGLGKFGRPTREDEVLENISKVKAFPYPPAFITFVHNFNNDLCGHARSLDPLKGLVDQEENLGRGLFPLGEKAIDLLLADKPVYIDLKHMSLNARKEYFELLQVNYPGRSIPILVSHGAATGLKMDGTSSPGTDTGLFNPADINFFDEEILKIGQSQGLFAVQFDSRRLASDKVLRTRKADEPVRWAARIIWNQIQHIAEILDRGGLFSWGTAVIGSDFDGTIKPLNGVLTVRDFPPLADALLSLANDYLTHQNTLTILENKAISPEELVYRFCYKNALDFIKNHY